MRNLLGINNQPSRARSESSRQIQSNNANIGARLANVGSLRGLAALLVAACCCLSAAAHGDLHEQIDALTQRIAEQPTDVELYLRRGELRRLHEDWDAAIADFERARTLAPQRAEIDLGLGRTLVDAGTPQAGIAVLDRYLTRNPAHGPALASRAAGLRAMELHLEAAEAFSAAAAAFPQPDPQLYFDSAAEFVAAGGANRDRALAVLDDGIERLGPLVTLELAAIDLDRQAGRFERALQRIDRIAEQTQRKEPWLARRGEVLELCGRPQEAVRAYEAAQRAIAALPAPRRRVAATLALEERVAAALDRLAAAANVGSEE